MYRLNYILRVKSRVDGMEVCSNIVEEFLEGRIIGGLSP